MKVLPFLGAPFLFIEVVHTSILIVISNWVVE